MAESQAWLCQRCNYTTSLKSTFKHHIYRKRVCHNYNNVSIEDVRKVFEESVVKPTNFKCPNCNSFLGSQPSLSRHMNHTCKKKPAPTNPNITVNIDFDDIYNLGNKAVTRLKKVASLLQNNTQTSANNVDVVVHKITRIENGRSVGVQTDFEQIPDSLTCLMNQVRQVQIPLVRNETFYQNILEIHLGGTHKVLASGITDITTDTFHAEIKHGKDWKSAVGQLLCYNKWDPKPELRLYLFGTRLNNALVKENVEQHGIKLFLLQDTSDGIVIKDAFNKTDEYISVSFKIC